MLVCGLGSLCASTGVAAHVVSTSDELIKQLRAAAASVAGELPVSVHYVKFAEAPNRRSALVAGADTGRVVLSFPAFQVRYSTRWIVVDAGFDHAAWTQFYGKTAVTYWPERWQEVQTLSAAPRPSC
jgi:hypothetical protein